MEYFLAIDIGASSGRHIISYIDNGKIKLEEMHRFDNKLVNRNGYNCWDTEYLFSEILIGIKKCGEAGKIPKTMAIDSWAVDFVLLDSNGDILGDSVAYRDRRTEGMDKVVDSLIPIEKLYGSTGIQKQIFNTIYQLMAVKSTQPKHMELAVNFLMIPEYFNYLLTGNIKNEYTNATSTNLVNADSKSWDSELIDALGLPKWIFGKLHMPTETVGNFTQDIIDKVGFDCKVILPATHDTGSAFLAVPMSEKENGIILSSGTWSLMGVENNLPITTELSRSYNFTNEGGAWYRYRYLKNIMGLWMIQSVRRELNGTSYIKLDSVSGVETTTKQWSFPELIAQARAASCFNSVIDVDKPRFLSPKSMINEIKDECKNTNQPVPNTVGEIMQCLYNSLSVKYANTVGELEKVTGKQYDCIHIVGGGCQDSYLNEMTAKATGLPVYAGPIEGTALGNIIVQMISVGEISDLARARAIIKDSFEIKEYR